MYYKKGINKNSAGMSADLGAVLNRENAAATLAAEDIVKTAEEAAEGGRPPAGQRSRQDGFEREKFEFGLMQAMYPETAKLLLPYVKKAVKNNIYSGSPVLRPIGPDRAFADKVTNEVIAAVCRENDEAEEICLDSHRRPWNKKTLFYELVYAMVLAEMFAVVRNASFNL